MSFKIQTTLGDEWELVFSDEPCYIHSLKMPPQSMEHELNTAVWMILVFPVWSSPDRHSVLAAIACAREHAGKFQLGVRPFDSIDEIYKWWPSRPALITREIALELSDDQRSGIHISTDPSSHPMWLVLREGQVVYEGVGPRSKEQLSQLMDQVLCGAL